MKKTIILIVLILFTSGLFSAQPSMGGDFDAFLQFWRACFGWDSVTGKPYPILVDDDGNIQAEVVGTPSGLSVETYSTTHDQFNNNANIQVGDADNDTTNPVFVTNSTDKDFTAEVYQAGTWSNVGVTGTFWQTTQPVSGTFYQATQPVSIADGSDITLGTKTDAKSTATDATSVSIMQVLKEISYMEQNPATRAVTGTFWQTTQPVSVATIPSHAVTNAGTFATQPSTLPHVNTSLPVVYNLTLANPDTEYSQAFTNAKYIAFKLRDNSDMRFAFVTGNVATPTTPWRTLPSGVPYYLGNADIASGTLYFAHDVGSVVVEIEIGQ